jgi:hypothetical protein
MPTRLVDFGFPAQDGNPQRILPRDMGLCPDRPAGFRDWFSLYPRFAIPGAGAKGGRGEADLAIGYFGKTAPGQTPQVLCD